MSDSSDGEKKMIHWTVMDAPKWETESDLKESVIVAKSLLRRIAHWGPIIALSIIFSIGFTASYFHILWWPITSSPWAFIHFLVFLTWNYLTLTNFCLAAYHGPGVVPFRWSPPLEEHQKRLQFCLVCNGYKAPRSHHCSKCGRCNLKMDHHCPWINNCVGHRNHLAFSKFLLFAIVGCIQASYILFYTLYHFYFRMWYMYYGHGTEPLIDINIWTALCGVFCFGLSIGVVVAVGVLLFMQVKGILKNRTQLEDYIEDKAHSRRVSGNAFVYPYDLGRSRNVCEVLIWDDLPKTSGLYWAHRSDCDQFTLSEEQIEQKRFKRDHACVVEIIEDYSGNFFGSWRFGWCVFFCRHWLEPSVAVKKGERWLSTRGSKHWAYGVLKNGSDGNEEKDRTVKGWFPRTCAMLVERRHSNRNQSAGEQ